MSDKCWKSDAARIVEELFPVTPREAWDGLLELRGLILGGRDWARTLEVFLACRQMLEQDHYLPFYRLRRLLAVSLQLEGVEGLPTVNLERLLRCRSFRHVEREVRRAVFEYMPTAAVELRLVEA